MNRAERRQQEKLLKTSAQGLDHSPQGLLQKAFAHQKAGELEIARDLYQKVLAIQPGNADALHMLGALAYEEGQYQDAVDYITDALKINERNAGYWT